jgi:serine/threonine protein kinase/Flp pilus assembly protein TadD
MKEREEMIRDVVEEYLAAVQESTAPDVEAILNKHPEIRTELEKHFEALLRLDRNFQALRDLSLPPLEAARVLSQSPQAPPSEISGFEIREELGRGGYGAVYLARQKSLDRLVALKLLTAEKLLPPGALKRFQREAESIGKLNHSNIVSIFDFGHEAGFYYIAQEFIPGITLARLISILKERFTPESCTGTAIATVLAEEKDKHQNWFTAPFAKDSLGALGTMNEQSYIVVCCKLILEISESLAHAHARGITHRDIKPSNIIIGFDGHAYLIDFGLTKDASVFDLTGTTDFLGTIYYASPEQVDTTIAPIGPTTDLYSLGITFFELLTWTRPYQGARIEELTRKILKSDPPKPQRYNSSIHRDLQTIIEKCIRKEPLRRYPSGTILAEDIANLLAFRPLSARPANIIDRVYYWLRRRPATATAILGSALILMGILMFLRHQQTQSLVGTILREGGTYYTLNLPDAAIDKFTEAVRLQPGNGLAYQERARTYLLLKKDYKKAKADLEQALGLSGVNSFQVRRMLTLVEEALGDKRAAGELTRKLFEGRPSDPDMASKYASDLSNAGDNKRAEAVIQQALQTHSTYYVLYMTRGSLHQNRKNYKAAASDYSRALEYAPADDAPTLAILYESIGQVQLQQTNYLAATKILREGVIRLPGATNLRKLYALSLIVNYDFDEAEFQAKRLLENEPDNPEMLTLLGMALAGSGKTNQAWAAHNKAYQLGDRSRDTLTFLADFNIRLYQLPEAKDILLTALIIFPRDKGFQKRLDHVNAFIKLRTVDSRHIQKAIIEQGGYFHERTGFAFVPPKGWIETKDPSGAISFELHSSSSHVRPHLQVDITSSESTPEKLWELTRAEAGPLGLAFFKIHKKEDIEIHGARGLHVDYSFHWGTNAIRIGRFDLRKDGIVYLFSCKSLMSEYAIIEPLCIGAVNSTIFSKDPPRVKHP